jgi:hypothetical protein
MASELDAFHFASWQALPPSQPALVTPYLNSNADSFTLLYLRRHYYMVKVQKCQQMSRRE